MYLDIEGQHMKPTEVKMYIVKETIKRVSTQGPYDQMATENLM